MILRVENSLGPFFSLSKSIPRSVGKRVEWMLGSSWRASDVVHKAFKHNSVSCNSVSSCSSLHFESASIVSRPSRSDHTSTRLR